MGAFDLLQHLRVAGLIVMADGDRLTVTPRAGLADDLRDRFKAHKAELLVALTAPAGPDAIAPASHAYANPEPWPEPQLDLHGLTHARLMRMGLDMPEAAKLAGWMALRVDTGDDRITCFECKHFRPTGRRCGNHVQAAMPRDLGLDLATMPQRCIGFKGARNELVQTIQRQTCDAFDCQRARRRCAESRPAADPGADPVATQWLRGAQKQQSPAGDAGLSR